MKRGEAYPSDWIKKESGVLLSDGRHFPLRNDNNQPMPGVTLTIEGVSSHKFDDGQQQRVLSFVETEARFGLNQTNWVAVEEITGQDDDENWAGHQIELYYEPNITFGAKRIGGVRIRQPQQAPAPAPTQPAAQPQGGNVTTPQPDPAPAQATMTLQPTAINGPVAGKIEGVACQVWKVTVPDSTSKWAVVNDQNVATAIQQAIDNGHPVSVTYVTVPQGNKITAATEMGDADDAGFGDDDIPFD